MRTSQAGINLIKQFEGCRLEAYKCPAGVWTIGYGHTAGVHPGQKISAAQAEAYLRADLEKYEKKVDKYSKYVWRQNEFDAMVSFAYNVGSIDQLTDKGRRDRKEIADAILKYNTAKVNGSKKVLPGLTRRRQAERTLFLSAGSDSNGSGIVKYSLRADGETQLSRNFKVKEFRCKDGSDEILVDVDFIRVNLQAIRDHFCAPVTINSAYRTESYNKKIGGAKSSYHMKGQAFDIVVKGRSPQEVARYAQSLGIPGIIQYNSFVHVDSRSKKYWARDDSGKVTIKNSF